MPSTDADAEAGAEPDDVQQFLLYLGSALTASGEAVNEIQERLRRVANAYGWDRASIAVLPTFTVVSLEPQRAATIEPTQQLGGPLRLDQTAAVFETLKDAEQRRITPADGSSHLLEIVSMQPRFGPVTTVIGHAILTVGICLVLQPTPGDLFLAALFGTLVGVMKLAGARWSATQMVMPVVAAFVVSALTFGLADHGWADADLRAMVAPLVTFLPGAALTMAVIELAAGEMVTGASRLVSGSLQLLLLGFGIVAGAQVAGVPSTDALANTPENLLGWWAPWLGVAVFGLGAHLYFSGPRGALKWLLLVLAVAWVGQAVGGEALGGYLSGFTGGLAMVLIAYLVEQQRGAPPAVVTFLVGFWLLVPGALGLIGIAEYLESDRLAGVQDFLGTLGAMLSIALGVLVGYPINKSLDRIPLTLQLPGR